MIFLTPDCGAGCTPARLAGPLLISGLLRSPTHDQKNSRRTNATRLTTVRSESIIFVRREAFLNFQSLPASCIQEIVGAESVASQLIDLDYMPSGSQGAGTIDNSRCSMRTILLLLMLGWLTSCTNSKRETTRTHAGVTTGRSLFQLTESEKR